MSDGVIFDENSEDNQVRNIRVVSEAPKGMLAWLIKNKIAKNGRQAEHFMLYIAIGIFVITVAICILNFYHPKNYLSDIPVGPPMVTVPR